MAIIYKCDKCHSETDKEESLKTIQIPQIDPYYSQFQTWNTKYHICFHCVARLHEFLKPDAEVVAG